MSFRIVCLTACFGAFLGSIALADDSTERAKLTGTWQSSTGEKGIATKAVWVLESKGDSMHIINSQGDKKMAEYACTLDGKECEVKDGGRKVKVTLYFNGPKLVVLETKGDEVVKRRFGTAEGDTLELEVIPMVPDGKTETLHFQRVQNGAAVASSR
jgi:hypothetical protein